MENQRKKLMVSADDFGIDPKANAAILSLLKKGRINRVGILIHGQISEMEAKELIASGAKLDLHLDFPIKKNRRRKLQEGVLGRSFNFLFCYLFGKMKTPLAEMEWEKQIQKFREIFGRLPDGINSHQHIHFFPPYFSAISKLAKKYEVSFLRFGKESLVKSRSSVYRILSRLHNKNMPAFITTGLDSSDFLTSLDWIGNPEEFLTYLPEGRTELVCHPERPEEYAIILKYF